MRLLPSLNNNSLIHGVRLHVHVPVGAHASSVDDFFLKLDESDEILSYISHASQPSHHSIDPAIINNPIYQQQPALLLQPETNQCIDLTQAPSQQTPPSNFPQQMTLDPHPQTMQTTFLTPQPMQTTSLTPQQMQTTSLTPQQMQTTSLTPQLMQTTSLTPQLMQTTSLTPQQIQTAERQCGSSFSFSSSQLLSPLSSQLFSPPCSPPSPDPPLSPQTPKATKIQRLMNNPKYKEKRNAGEFANKLALIIIGPEVMLRSGLSTGTGEKRGKLLKLEDSKLDEIQSYVKKQYKGQGDVWTDMKLKEKIGSKCHRLRTENQGKKS